MPKTRFVTKTCCMGVRRNVFVRQMDVLKGSNGGNGKFET